MVKECPLCRGRGAIYVANGTIETEESPFEVCPVCNGEGETDEQKQTDSPVILYKYHGLWKSDI